MSWAALGSLNSSAAVLFVPTIFASAFRSSTRSSLKRYAPYSAKAIPAAHNAANVLIMITYVIFRRSDSLRVHCISVVRAPLVSSNREGQGQQFRANFQPRAAGRAHINGHPYVGVSNHKLNHPSGFDKFVHVPDSQDAGAAQACQNRWESFFFRGANEQHVEVPQIRGIWEHFHFQ